MKSVLILCVPEDYSRVRNIVAALNESDVDVFWDRTAPGSSDWKETLDRAATARAIVFFFSEAATSAENGPFTELAAESVRLGKALCVMLDSVELPPDMDGCTVYDVRGWRSRASSLFMLDLVAGVKAKSAGLDPPTPRAARQLLMQRLYIAVPSAIAIFALAVGLYRDLGADKIASPMEASAWSRVKPGSCDDLRAFLGEYGDGVHADEAQAHLAGRKTISSSAMNKVIRPLPLYVSSAGSAAQATAGAARSAARTRAEQEAKRLCQGLAQAASSKLLSATAELRAMDCQNTGSGALCSAEGQALCSLNEPEETTVEVCGPSD